ncbi:sigma-70 family RNA polymerase sigma factor [Amycolatopsis regifaucium]|uniref:RNA polymerase subunit sigma-70 n=1 Tax=Amycolatopsis regifaucium TaxID=546365 RepID=A0A154MRP6_9PSEU|nr:sigma-70 family RNA polymerase sigma factor [Amycolatopsis regifaucium]KZB86945.1 RNA polymerase subunit sigma-70 [Amycolatopsis regifaucium]OKA09375.1 RNA polymerase subunit sigma-70 [Amycolatopsis regifaucium]SFH59610.1 RNA polymerase sigma-70 factor, ECF subfamily [Amycolatopsis regifaucium]
MTGEALASAFEEQRGRLVAVAHRMLGSRADAEDAVQEAWLRLARQDADTIGNLSGWLTTVVGRVCIDVLRSRKTRPEDSYDEPPEPLVIEDSLEEDAMLAESVGVALLVVLDTLGPAERLAFVLHDLFAVPFTEVGEILGKSPDAAKMLASRARRKVQGRRPADESSQRAVVEAFLAAAREGDFDGLIELLHPDVTWRSQTRHGEVVRLGAAEVATRVQRGARAAVTTRAALVDGKPGVVSWSRTGKLLGVMSCTVVDGRIAGIDSVSDPRRLAAMGVTSWEPSSSK